MITFIVCYATFTEEAIKITAAATVVLISVFHDQLTTYIHTTV